MFCIYEGRLKSGKFLKIQPFISPASTNNFCMYEGRLKSSHSKILLVNLRMRAKHECKKKLFNSYLWQLHKFLAKSFFYTALLTQVGLPEYGVVEVMVGQRVKQCAHGGSHKKCYIVRLKLKINCRNIVIVAS